LYRACHGALDTQYRTSAHSRLYFPDEVSRLARGAAVRFRLRRSFPEERKVLERLDSTRQSSAPSDDVDLYHHTLGQVLDGELSCDEVLHPSIPSPCSLALNLVLKHEVC